MQAPVVHKRLLNKEAFVQKNRRGRWRPGQRDGICSGVS